jgi:hypothetical protein
VLVVLEMLNTGTCGATNGWSEPRTRIPTLPH